ncbi:hypothetical protein VTN00DRAFT_3432 [Thermoascus crustaceus]|uniref:uncharacterized protein n=1 Tax=Thermoascus crustaceus TaxID=5088 RepID=UPI0037440781
MHLTREKIAETVKIDTESQRNGLALNIANGDVKVLETGEIVNASGRKQELERNFSLLNMCAVAIVIGNCWTITGATITLALYNGGAPGILYEFIIATAFYLLTAHLAEMASAIPSSGGVYHWASVTPGRKAGRVIGFFAG